MRELTAGGRVKSLPRGGILFREGQASDDVYVVLSGTLSVSVKGESEHAVSELRRGDLVGEIAAISGGVRSATVKATSPARLVRLSPDAFAAMLVARPHLAGQVADEARRRLLEGGVTVLLARVFGGLEQSVRDAIAEQIEWITLKRGDVLYHSGQDADAAFIVVYGMIRLSAGSEHSDAEFDQVGAGEIIGASSLVSDGKRKATAYASRDAYLVRIPRESLKVLEDRNPRAVLAITRALLKQVKIPASRRVSGKISIAVIAGSPDVDLRLFVSKLADELAQHGAVAHAWSARIDSALGREGIAQSANSEVGHIALTRWLQDLHHRNRIVVLEGDRDWTPWTERAVREADRVLVVTSNDDVGPSERALYGMFPEGQRPRISVLLLANGAEAPKGTAARLAGRTFDEYYHLRAGVPSDFQRLGRVVAGRSVGLALGGGGSRGFAHIGVLRALWELNVPVDLVGGASIGAIISALAADECSPVEIQEMVESGFSRVRDYTLPVVSVLKGKRTAELIRKYFGERTVEDLGLPAFVVTTNLTRNCASYHRGGDLTRLLRASTAIPGVYPPVVIDGELHVDGGVLDNLPVEEMRRWHPDARIIAVDLTPLAEPRARNDFGLWMSGVRAAGRKIRRDRKRRLPGLGETMVRVSVVASTRDRDRLVSEGAADLYVPLTLRGVNPMDFKTVKPVVETGYEQALPLIRAWIEAGGLDGSDGGE